MKIEIEKSRDGLHGTRLEVDLEIEDEEIIEWITDNKKGDLDFLFSCVNEGSLSNNDMRNVAEKILDYLESHDPGEVAELIEKYN